MIFFYALGGGLGHLLRARAVLNTLFHGEEAFLLTSCPRHDEFPELQGVQTIAPPFASGDGEFAVWLERLIRKVSPELVCIDTFPAGLFGELPPLLSQLRTEKYLFSRLLNFPVYERACGRAKISFDRIYCCESLTDMHLSALSRYGTNSFELDLIQPEISSPILSFVPDKPFWMVDHSGPRNEVRELLEFARATARHESFDGLIYLFSREDLGSLGHLERQSTFLHTPVLYPLAEKIFTACGFHAIREAGLYPHKHMYLPFERKFDEQFIRAAMHFERSHPQSRSPLFEEVRHWA